jgi:hypothetical protein
MQLDHKIDETIIQILNDEKIIKKYSLSIYDRAAEEIREKQKEVLEEQQLKLHFNGILEALKEYYHAITNRILSLHLARLEDQRIIERSDFKPGLGRFCWLSKNIKLALQLELPIKVKSERGEFSLWPEKHTDKNKKSYLLLLSLAAIGVSVPKPVEDDSNPPLGAFYDNRQHKAFTMSKPLPDISTSDFLHTDRDFNNNRRFHYVKFKNISEVEWYFQKLMEFKPPMLGPAEQIEWIKKVRHERKLKLPPSEEGEEKRYGIVDKRLHEFMSYCVGMFGFTETIMDHIWSYKRKPRDEEIEWYRYIYGEDDAKRYFTRINEERTHLERIIGKTDRERKRARAAAEADYKTCHEDGDFQSPKYNTAYKIQMHFVGIERADSIKSMSYYWHQKLSSEEYRDVRTNYGIITDALMNIAYPDFMENIFQPMR